MLVQKLLRIDEDTIQKINNILLKMSEKEYISFSAFVRKLIKIGLNHLEDNMENITENTAKKSFVEKIRKISNNSNVEKKIALETVCKEIESIAGYNTTKISMPIFRIFKVIYNSLNNKPNSVIYNGSTWEPNTVYRESNIFEQAAINYEKYNSLLGHVILSLRDEGFNISSSIDYNRTDPGIVIDISWDK